MTRDEFDQFFARHTSRFPQFESWLSERLDDEAVGEYLDSFRLTLQHVGYRDALAASQEIFEGPGLPFGEHPAALRQIAQRMAADRRPRDRWADGQPTFRCLRCEDTGFLEVWSEAAMAAMRERGRLDGVRYLTYAVRCTCGRPGTAWCKQTFDERLHLPAPARAYQDREDYLAELAEFATRRPSNYEPAFEEVS